MCLKSLLANDYPKDRLEVLVVDGMSEDGTRNVVTEYAKRWPVIKLLDNPKRITPAALNIGIRQARGDVLIRMDAHARVDCGYIRRCVGTLLVRGADNVGGIMKTVPKQKRLVGRAIALCLSHRFGVGNSYFRVHAMKPKWVDTVFGGCYRREIFKRIGFFNERLELYEAMTAGRRHDVDREFVVDANGVLTLLFEQVVLTHELTAGTVRQIAQGGDPPACILARRLDEKVEILGESVVAVGGNRVTTDECIANVCRIE